MELTTDMLMAGTGCTSGRALGWLAPIQAACDAYEINTPRRVAAFLAQIGHESGGLRYTAEIWGPTLAQIRYEGRKDLGNTQRGDGKRYKGRGLIQTTGRFNHARARDGLRLLDDSAPDFELEPEALERPKWAALSAGLAWSDRSLNALADVGDFRRITLRINGGTNGMADRLALWDAAKVVLA